MFFLQVLAAINQYRYRSARIDDHHDVTTSNDNTTRPSTTQLMFLTVTGALTYSFRLASVNLLF